MKILKEMMIVVNSCALILALAATVTAEPVKIAKKESIKVIKV